MASVLASVSGMPMDVGECSSTVERTGERKVGVGLGQGGGGGKGISVLVAPVLPDFFLHLGGLPTPQGTVETDLERVVQQPVMREVRTAPNKWEAECEKKTTLSYHSFALLPSFLITCLPTCLHTHLPTCLRTHLEPVEVECNKKTMLATIVSPSRPPS